jgi:ABC-type transporter Mla MlaB component
MINGGRDMNPRIENNRCIFDISGGLTGESAVDLIVQLRRAVMLFPGSELILDLSGVDEIDAAGIWVLVEAKKIDGGTVRITGHSAAVLTRLGIRPLAVRAEAANDSGIVRTQPT